METVFSSFATYAVDVRDSLFCVDIQFKWEV